MARDEGLVNGMRHGPKVHPVVLRYTETKREQRKAFLQLMKDKNNYPLFSWCLGALVVNLLWVIGLWKSCTVSVPDFAVHLYRKVPHSTAKRVKKFGPESLADYRKVMATMMIRKLDEVPKKRFCQNAPQNPAFKKVR